MEGSPLEQGAADVPHRCPHVNARTSRGDYCESSASRPEIGARKLLSTERGDTAGGINRRQTSLLMPQ